MTQYRARSRRRRARVGPQELLVATAALMIGSAACGDDEGTGGVGGTAPTTTTTTSGNPQNGSTQATTTSQAGPTSASQSSGTGGEGPLTLRTVANDGTIFRSPLDATPNAAGDTVFFTAMAPSGEAGVFTVNTAGGNLGPHFVGEPFSAPLGIASSTDGATLYVADTGTSAEAPARDTGAIITLSTTSGATPSVVEGTRGYAPRSVVVLDDGGTDVVYFTGRDRQTGAPGVFSMTAGAVTSVASGGAFVDPSGIAVAAFGDVYVADTTAAANGRGRILLVSGGTTAPFGPELDVGYPFGIALSLDGSTLFATGLDPVTRKDVVYMIDIANGTVTTFTAGIDTFSEPAGIHRSPQTSTYAWADGRAGGAGSVFTLSYP